MLLTDHLTHTKVEQLFSDAETIHRWVAVEGILARVQGELGVIGAESAEIIHKSLQSFQPDLPALQIAMERNGVPISELVHQLRQHVDSPHSDFIHYGATTQDIMDTALVLQLRDALGAIESLLDQIIHQLAVLADTHRATLMAGRTHSQHALPMTFGLKVTNWLAPLLRQRERLTELLPRLFVVQFGGAAGTLAALGDDGLRVQAALAAALDLNVPLAVWHNQRDTLVELANWLSLTTAAMGKIAKDVILLSQSEIGELRESDDSTRGGSSTMPQKSNPMVSEAIIAIHRLNVGHLTTLHNAMLHDHERGTDSWQAEWYALPAMLSMTAAALEKGVWLTDHLVVDANALRETIVRSNGLMLAEAATFALANHMPHSQAKQVVKQAIQTATAENHHLIDVLREHCDAPLNWQQLRDETNYLGVSDALIDRILDLVVETTSQLPK